MNKKKIQIEGEVKSPPSLVLEHSKWWPLISNNRKLVYVIPLDSRLLGLNAIMNYVCYSES